MTILPSGPVPAAVPFAAAAALVILIGFLLDAVTLVSAIVVWVILAGYAIYTWRTGLGQGTDSS